MHSLPKAGVCRLRVASVMLKLMGMRGYSNDFVIISDVRVSAPKGG